MYHIQKKLQSDFSRTLKIEFTALDFRELKQYIMPFKAK